MKLSYKSAGVDIASADRVQQRIKKLASSSFTSEVLGRFGVFGGFFSLDKKFKEPVLVSSTDGVGTKLKVALMAGKHDTVGEDLVNHCVNDILAHGARPLFFLDYIACGKGTLKFVPEIVKGISRCCQKTGCALIGGETAQMPEFYAEGEYDLAGFIVGAVNKDQIVDGKKIKPGDQLLGLSSTGLHTNGYTLARKIFFEKAGFKLRMYLPELKCTLQEELLKVHRCYLPALQPFLAEDFIKGMAHITGGGIEGNIIRILPEGVQVKIELDSWRVPPVFRLIQNLGKIDRAEMYKTFNMGIGMILVVKEKEARNLTIKLSRRGETVYHIGEIVKGRRSVRLVG